MVKFSNVNKDGKFKMFTNDITSPTMVKFHNAIISGEFSYFHWECSYPFKYHLVKVKFHNFTRSATLSNFTWSK